MLRGLFLLLLFQLIGEVLARSLALPAPGPVIGLLALAVSLALWRRRSGEATDVDQTDLGKTANALLGALSLLFVPAGVGVVQYFDLLARYGVALGVALVVSTVLTLLATVGVFLWVKQRTAP
jgi:holin-like protein